MAKRDKSLTVKQERFCLEVVQGKSFTKAYREAGYSDQPNSPIGIRIKASRLRREPAVAARIEELQALLVEQCLMTKQQWLEKMDRMARADVRKMFNPQGDMKPMEEIGEEESELIEGVEVIEQFTKVGDHAEHTGYVKRLKLTSRRQILKDYGEARGWLVADDGQEQKVIILRKWIREEHHEHLTAINQRAGGESDGSIIDVGGRSGQVYGRAEPDRGCRMEAGAGHTPSTGSGIEAEVSTIGTASVRGAGVGPEEFHNAPVSVVPPGRHLSGGLIRRKILPGLHDGERPESDEL